MWVLLKINFDISCSVVPKCIKGPLISTHSACENVFTKQLMELSLIICGDVEQNPGPEKDKSLITFCYWNLNVLMAHNFIKVSLLQTLAVTNGHDIICLTETSLTELRIGKKKCFFTCLYGSPS